MRYSQNEKLYGDGEYWRVYGQAEENGWPVVCLYAILNPERRRTIPGILIEAADVVMTTP